MFLENEDIVWFQIRCGLSVETLILCCAGEEVRVEARRTWLVKFEDNQIDSD